MRNERPDPDFLTLEILKRTYSPIMIARCVFGRELASSRTASQQQRLFAMMDFNTLMCTNFLTASGFFGKVVAFYVDKLLYQGN